MRIALVTPHPSPFTPGGAENLFFGLQKHILEHTDHQCDIVSLISPEADFWELVGSYRAFAELDLSAYDVVISGKYPAWMVKHPDHRCYMLHRLRGLYDTYAQPTQVDLAAVSPAVRTLTAWMLGIRSSGAPMDDHVGELFDRLEALRQCCSNDPALAFPGPFARELVHFLDAAALSSHRITRYAAISRTVAARADYFPDDAFPDVLYPPPHRNDYRTGKAEYLFTSSRLDGPKRLDLLVKAMRLAKADLPLLIAGKGPEETRLKDLAAGDPRIQFLGFVPDDQMPGYYADALAVPFIPFDEDYGLVTIEAMLSGKPVVTCADSGGPCEFVDDGVTGLVADASAQQLAEKIDLLAQDPARAAQMGLCARERVNSVSWQSVVAGLLDGRSPALSQSRRPKITVTTTFPVYPPMGGGQARVFNLYRSLARDIDVDVVSFAASGSGGAEIDLAPGFREIRIAKSVGHENYETDYMKASGGVPVGDIAAIRLSRLTPDFGDALRYASVGSRALVACHPFLVEELSTAAPRLPIWYEAQDVETSLKRKLLAEVPGSTLAIADVERVERTSWLESQLVYACTNSDLAELQRLFGPTRARLAEVPNGVALDQIPFTGWTNRIANKRRIGVDSTPLALFMGSWHGPNIEAVELILGCAPLLPRVAFLIVGSVAGAFKKRQLPQNVRFLGLVDDRTRDVLMASADVALNPMLSGSGSNLKMLDYLAAGLPVVSTKFGTRGIAVTDGVEVRFAEPETFAQSIEHVLSQSADELRRMGEAGRLLVESRYSWTKIADDLRDTALPLL